MAGGVVCLVIAFIRKRGLRIAEQEQRDSTELKEVVVVSKKSRKPRKTADRMAQEEAERILNTSVTPLVEETRL